MTTEFKKDLNTSEKWLTSTDSTTYSEIPSHSHLSQFYKAIQNQSKYGNNSKPFSDTQIESSESRPRTDTEMTNSCSRHYSIRNNQQRLRAGQERLKLDFMRPTLFQRGVAQKKPRDFDKDELPTNWGLLKTKQEDWQGADDFVAHPTSTYSVQFKWWGKERESDAYSAKTPTTTSIAIPVKDLTVKDWNLRGHRAEMLPIPWQPPEPRWPSELARSSHTRPDELRWKEINSRLARISYEVQHPVEKWAANLYLN